MSADVFLLNDLKISNFRTHERVMPGKIDHHSTKEHGYPITEELRSLDLGRSHALPSRERASSLFWETKCLFSE